VLSLGPFFANTLQEAVLYIRLANVAGILAVYSVAAAAWVLAAHTKALTARLGAGSAMGIRAAERSAGLKIFSVALCVVSPGMLCGLLSPWVMNRTGIMVHHTCIHRSTVNINILTTHHAPHRKSYLTLYSCCVLTLCTYTVYLYCVLVLYSYCVLVLYLYCILILYSYCTHTVYSYCTHTILILHS
jgi:hypothetical protein